MLASFDVDKLDASVPVNETIKIALGVLLKKSIPSPVLFNRLQFREPIKLSVCDISFQFRDRSVIQCKGVAMGSLFGPIFTDLFM